MVPHRMQRYGPASCRMSSLRLQASIPPCRETLIGPEFSHRAAFIIINISVKSEGYGGNLNKSVNLTVL